MDCGEDQILTVGQSEIDLLKNLLVSFGAMQCGRPWQTDFSASTTTL